MNRQARSVRVCLHMYICLCMYTHRHKVEESAPTLKAPQIAGRCERHSGIVVCERHSGDWNEWQRQTQMIDAHTDAHVLNAGNDWLHCAALLHTSCRGERERERHTCCRGLYLCTHMIYTSITLSLALSLALSRILSLPLLTLCTLLGEVFMHCWSCYLSIPVHSLVLHPSRWGLCGLFLLVTFALSLSLSPHLSQDLSQRSLPTLFLSIYPLFLSIYPLFLPQTLCLSIYLFFPQIHISICLSMYLYLCTFKHVYLCLSACLSIFISLCLSIYYPYIHAYIYLCLLHMYKGINICMCIYVFIYMYV